MTELTEFRVREIKPFLYHHGIRDLVPAQFLDPEIGKASGSRCLGAYALDVFAQVHELLDCPDRLLGVIEYGPLPPDDWLRSASRFEQLGLRAAATLGYNNLGKRVLGIYSLAVVGNLGGSLEREVTKVLIQNAIYEAGGREVRVARCPDDPALILLRQKGFRLRSRSAEQVVGPDIQQIYARPRSFGGVRPVRVGSII